MNLVLLILACRAVVLLTKAGEKEKELR